MCVAPCLVLVRQTRSGLYSFCLNRQLHLLLMIVSRFNDLMLVFVALHAVSLCTCRFVLALRWLPGMSTIDTSFCIMSIFICWMAVSVRLDITGRVPCVFTVQIAHRRNTSNGGVASQGCGAGYIPSIRYTSGAARTKCIPANIYGLQVDGAL